VTEQSTNPPAEGTPPPSEAPKAAPKADKSEGKRYAAYDKTYLRFVGDVVDSRKDAAAQAKEHGVKDYEIREV
jgi:hypothetical protein